MQEQDQMSNNNPTTTNRNKLTDDPDSGISRQDI